MAQQGALLRLCAHLGELLHQARELALRVGFFQEVDLFLGKVERGFDQHAQVNQRVAQRVHLVRKRPRQRPAGAARRGLGAGIDQIRHGLGLCQVHLVVHERTLGEFAGPSRAQTRQQRLLRDRVGLCGHGQTTRHEQLQHHRATVRLQLQHVLSCVGLGRHKMHAQAMVDGRAIGVQKRQVSGLARRQAAADQSLHKSR